MTLEQRMQKGLNGDTDAQKDALWHMVRNRHSFKSICEALGKFKNSTSDDDHADVVYSLSQAFCEQKNWKDAAEFLAIAADMGVAEAWYNLGYFYLNGLGGLEKNPEKQLKCLIMSARLGCREARNTLRCEGIDW